MDVLSALTGARLVPVVVLDDPTLADGLAGALVAGGLPVAEVTFRTAAAPDAIRAMSDRGDILVGAGTVLTAAQVDRRWPRAPDTWSRPVCRVRWWSVARSTAFSRCRAR